MFEDLDNIPRNAPKKPKPLDKMSIEELEDGIREMQDEIKRYEWEAGDVIYIPPSTIHQHFNGDPLRPARPISCTNRIYKNSGLNNLERIRRRRQQRGDERIRIERDRRHHFFKIGLAFFGRR